jgi:hypothetical protein
MSRPSGSKNKKKRTEYRSFECPSLHDSGFVRLPYKLLNHDAWINLSSSSRLLYIDMRRVSAGRDTFTYSMSLAKKIMWNDTFIKARDGLMAAGFIDYLNAHCARDKKETAQFRFSDKWHNQWHSSCLDDILAFSPGI